MQQKPPKHLARKKFECACGRMQRCDQSKDKCMSNRCNPCITAANKQHVERNSHGNRMTRCPGCDKPMRLDALKARGPDTTCHRCKKLGNTRQTLEQSWQRIHVKDRKTASIWKNVQSVADPAS